MAAKGYIPAAGVEDDIDQKLIPTLSLEEIRDMGAHSEELTACASEETVAASIERVISFDKNSVRYEGDFYTLQTGRVTSFVACRESGFYLLSTIRSWNTSEDNSEAINVARHRLNGLIAQGL